MPITAEHAGRRYPATAPFPVRRDQIVEFAAALGDTDPAYSAGDAPLAPPTFAVVVASQAWGLMFDDPELGLALERIMHAEQGFRWERPLRAGDELTATLTIDKVRPRGRMEMIGTSIELRTTAGELVCTATGTFVHTRPAEAAPATEGSPA